MKKLIGFAGFLMVLGLGVVPLCAVAQGICDVAAVEPTRDSDGDGFTDLQECTGITTVGTSPAFFPRCGIANADGVVPPRASCVDPSSKDLFVIIRLPATGSLLPAGFNPYAPMTAYGINFNGLNTLGLAVHTLTPAQAATDRSITSPVLNLPAQKAISVTESLDPNGTILGNCQYGTPSGLDGCVIYTQRTKTFIASACGNAAVQTPAGTSSTQNEVLLAYSAYLMLHEAGHSLGGLTGEYNSRFGGYHYKPGAGLVMEQAVTYTVKGGCKFYISPNWNATLDPSAVRLK